MDTILKGHAGDLKMTSPDAYLANVNIGASSYIQHAGIICRAEAAFSAWQSLRTLLRHSHAGTLMLAIAASVLTQSAARILRLPLNFGALSPGFMRRSCAEPPASVAHTAWG